MASCHAKLGYSGISWKKRSGALQTYESACRATRARRVRPREGSLLHAETLARCGVLRSAAPFPNSKNAHAGVRVDDGLWAGREQQQDGGFAQHQRCSRSGPLPDDESDSRRSENREARRRRRSGNQLLIERVEIHRGAPRLRTLDDALILDRVDLLFPTCRVESPMRYGNPSPSTITARGALSISNTKSSWAIEHSDHAGRLGRDQARARNGQHQLDRVTWVRVTSDRTVVLDTEDRDPTVGVRETGNLLRDLVSYLASVPRAFLSTGPSYSDFRSWYWPSSIAMSSRSRSSVTGTAPPSHVRETSGRSPSQSDELSDSRTHARRATSIRAVSERAAITEAPQGGLPASSPSSVRACP